MCNILIFLTSNAQVNFTTHISPIIFTHCSPCHKKNGAGPFELTNYENVRKRANTIQIATSIGYMPPYHADIHYSQLSEANVLTANEIALIKKWVETAMPEGKLPSPIYVDNANLDKPDLEISFPLTSILGNNVEKFYHTKAYYQIKEPKQICRCEFEPGNPKIVHHSNVFLYDASANPLAAMPPFTADGDVFTSNFEIEKFLNLINYDGTISKKTASVCDFFPGMKSVIYPKGIYKTFLLPQKGVFLASATHYSASSTTQMDKSKIKLWYCKESPQRSVFGHTFGSPTHQIMPPFPIKANKISTLATWEDFKKDISLLSVQPHAHLLATNIKMYAITPSNITIPILKLSQWDIRWQRVYKLKKCYIFLHFQKFISKPITIIHQKTY